MFRHSWLAMLIALSGVALSAQAERPRTNADFRAAMRAARAVTPDLSLIRQASTRAQVRTAIKDGMICERGAVIANVDYDTFMRRFDPARWSINLPQRWTGSVDRIKESPKHARSGLGAVLQREDMTLGFPALRMQKDVVVVKGKDRSRASWHVTDSPGSALTLFHKTVAMDDGWIEFSRTRDNRVLITTGSNHIISTLPSLPVEKLAPDLALKMAARGMGSYWTKILSRYQAIAEGRQAAK